MTASRGIGPGNAPGCVAAQFQPGNPGPPKRVKKKLSELSEETVDQLEAMRLVASRSADKDSTHQQYGLRAWFRADKKGFLSKIAELEKAEKIQEAKREAKEERLRAARDEPTERVLELIDRLLEEATLDEAARKRDALPG